MEAVSSAERRVAQAAVVHSPFGPGINLGMNINTHTCYLISLPCSEYQHKKYKFTSLCLSFRVGLLHSSSIDMGKLKLQTVTLFRIGISFSLIIQGRCFGVE